MGMKKNTLYDNVSMLAELVSPLPPKSNPGKLTCAQLYQMLEDRDTQLILMDVRSIEDFQESRLTHKAIINVPASAVKPGLVNISITWALINKSICRRLI